MDWELELLVVQRVQRARARWAFLMPIDSSVIDIVVIAALLPDERAKAELAPPLR